MILFLEQSLLFLHLDTYFSHMSHTPFPHISELNSFLGRLSALALGDDLMPPPPPRIGGGVCTAPPPPPHPLDIDEPSALEAVEGGGVDDGGASALPPALTCSEARALFFCSLPIFSHSLILPLTLQLFLSLSLLIRSLSAESLSLC